MPKSKKNIKKYQIQRKFVIIVALEVEADTLAQALEKDSQFEESDFLTVKGDHVDSSSELHGVFSKDWI